MIPLLIVEMRRVMARTLARALLLAALIAIAVTGLAVFTANPPATVRHAEYVDAVNICAQGYGGTPASRRAYCETAQVDQTFQLASTTDPDRSPLIAPGAALLFAGFILGASLIGAEWQAGSVVIQLTWESRRLRLFLAKTAGVAAVATASSLALLVAFVVVALVPTAVLKGSTVGVDGAWLADLAGWLIRQAVAVGCLAALGAALAMIGRRTSLAIIVAFAYFVAGDAAIVTVWKDSRSWLPLSNIVHLLIGKSLYPEALTRSPLLAGLVLAGYITLVMAGAASLFCRRDVLAN